MGEEGRVEVDLQALAAGPFLPAAEVLGLHGVAVDGLAPEFSVHGVEIDAVAARDEGERLGHIGAELVRIAGPSRGAPGDLQAAAGQALGAPLEADDVVPLPAMERQGDRLEPGQGFFGIDAPLGVFVAGRRVGFFDNGRIHPHPSSKERHGYTSPSMGCQPARISRNRALARSQAGVPAGS
jgi:hypothetical protein